MNEITNFLDFAKWVKLKTIYIDENPDNYYITVFSYFRDNINWILCSFYWENQFDTAREYWYHDAITQARNILKKDAKILILWWWDFMNYRFLKDFEVKLVDIDRFVTEIFSTHPLLTSLNKYKNIDNYNFINSDWVKFVLENLDKKFDHIILDLPVLFSSIEDEIKWYWLERFFTKEFFIWKLFSLLNENWSIVMQADDNINWEQNKEYFEQLIIWSSIKMIRYNLNFKYSKYKQYFQFFTQNDSTYNDFIKNLPDFNWELWLFDCDKYFIDFQNLYINWKITHEEYIKILTWL